MSFASMTLNVLKILVVGFTLELQVWCKGPCNCNLLWVWRGKMYLLQLYLVTMEIFAVQRSLSSPPRIGYTTLENTPDQKQIWKPFARCACCTCSGSKILMNGEIEIDSFFISSNKLCQKVWSHVFYKAT